MDINKRQIHSVNLDEGPSSHKVSSDLDISISTTADIEGNDDEFAFGGQHGFGVFNRKTSAVRYLKKYWSGDVDASSKDSLMRGNDGAVDSRGRFWVGTMIDPVLKPPTDAGVVFRLDPDMSLHRMIEGVTIPNGITWTQDDKTMYFNDSTAKVVWTYDYDIETGDIANKREFYRFSGDEAPDGHALDEEGYLWQCVYGVGKIIRISPAGKVVAEIVLPTRCVTCPVFAGEDIYITSAEEEAPDKFPESVKFQGCLFKCHVGVRGLKRHRFKLT